MKSCADIQTRMQGKFYITPSCWHWVAGKSPKGYGVISAGKRSNGMLRAHRVSYELYVGEIPKGMQVLHKCDNPSCINPDHLFLGTNAENVIDKTKKGRSRLVDVLGGEQNERSKLTDKQVVDIRNDNRSTRKIAKEYGVGKSLIWSVKALKTRPNIAFVARSSDDVFKELKVGV